MRAEQERANRNASVVADSARYSPDQLAVMYGISKTTVYNILAANKNRDRNRDRNIIVPEAEKNYPKGFCLLCKCGDPNRAVPMYQGEDAPECPACRGTGKYIDEIMDPRMERMKLNIVMRYSRYKYYVKACEAAGISPTARDSWKHRRSAVKRRRAKCTQSQ